VPINNCKHHCIEHVSYIGLWFIHKSYWMYELLVTPTLYFSIQVGNASLKYITNSEIHHAERYHSGLFLPRHAINGPFCVFVFVLYRRWLMASVAAYYSCLLYNLQYIVYKHRETIGDGLFQRSLSVSHAS
jgi:hypothetical protein